MVGWNKSRDATGGTEANDANDRHREHEHSGDGNREPEPAEKTVVTLSTHLRRNADKR